jgi:hypothetical protein
MPSSTISILLFAVSLGAVTLQPEILLETASAVAAVKFPTSRITLSLLAERKNSIAKKVKELQSKRTYGKTEQTAPEHQDRIQGAMDAQILDLQKQAAECAKCEKAEIKLQGAYNESLAAHKYVEAVAASVLAQQKAYNIYMNASADHSKAVQEKATTLSNFDAAKKLLLANLNAKVTKTDAFTPLTYPGVLKLDPVYDELLKDVNDAAKLDRKAAAKEVFMKGVMDKKKGLSDQAIEDSKATKLCAAECLPADVIAAEKVSGGKDLLVTNNQTLKTDACAAIDVASKA